jgi:hypothetical protein
MQRPTISSAITLVGAVALALACSPAAALEDDDVIVRVQDQVITYGEFKESWASSPMAGVDLEGPGGRRIKLGILKPLVDRKLMYLDALRSGVEDSPEFRKITAPFAGQAGEADLAAFRAMALSAAHFERTRQRFTPDDEELDRLCRERADVTTLPEKVKLQLVVVKERELAERIAAQARAGTNLNLLARDHSIAPTAKEDLGVLGWVPRGAGIPALEEVAFGLAPGEIGGPVEAEAGWYVVRVLDRREPFVRPVEEARALLRRRIPAERLETHLTRLAEEFKPLVDPAFLDDPAVPAEGEGAQVAAGS